MAGWRCFRRRATDALAFYQRTAFAGDDRLVANGRRPASALRSPERLQPTLYDVLMVKRNEALARRAAGTAAGTLRGSRRGALHLYGEGNLPQILK